MKKIFLFFLFLLIPDYSFAAADNPSLFFNSQEIKAINEQVRSLPPSQSTLSRHLVHLDSILFFGPNKWTVWMQGKKWTPETDSPDLHIINVNAEAVYLSALLQSGEAVSNIELKPHQSLNLLTGKVVEGF